MFAFLLSLLLAVCLGGVSAERDYKEGQEEVGLWRQSLDVEWNVPQRGASGEPALDGGRELGPGLKIELLPVARNQQPWTICGKQEVIHNQLKTDVIKSRARY